MNKFLLVTLFVIAAASASVEGATVKPKVLQGEADRKGKQMFDQTGLNLQGQQGLFNGQGGLGQQLNQFQNNPLLNLQAQLNNQNMQQAMLMNGLGGGAGATGGNMNLQGLGMGGMLNNQPNLNLQAQQALLGNQQLMGLQGQQGMLNPVGMGLMNNQMGMMSNQMMGMQGMGMGMGGFNRFNQQGGGYNPYQTLLAQQLFHKIRLQTPGLMSNLHNLKLMMGDASLMQAGLGMGGQMGQQMNPQMMAQLLAMQNSGMNLGGLNGGLNQGLGGMQLNNQLGMQSGLLNNPALINQLRMNNMNGLQGQLGLNGLQGQLGMNGLQGQLGLNGLQGQLGMNGLGMNYPSLMGRTTAGSDALVNNVVSRLPFGVNSGVNSLPLSLASRQNDAADAEDYSTMFDELSKGALVGARQPKEKLAGEDSVEKKREDVKNNVV